MIGRLFSIFLVSWNNTSVACEVWTCGRVVSFYPLVCGFWSQDHCLGLWKPLPVTFFQLYLVYVRKYSERLQIPFLWFCVWISFLSRHAILMKLFTCVSVFFFFFCKIEVTQVNAEDFVWFCFVLIAGVGVWVPSPQPWVSHRYTDSSCRVGMTPVKLRITEDISSLQMFRQLAFLESGLNF